MKKQLISEKQKNETIYQISVQNLKFYNIKSKNRMTVNQQF